MDKTKEPTITEAISEVARDVAKAIPDSLLVRIIAEKLDAALQNLVRNYGTDDVMDIVKQAVDEAVAELLRTNYTDRIHEIADPLANQAIAIAKREVEVCKKDNRRY